MLWTVQQDISGNDSVGQAEAATWDNVPDFVPSVEHNQWNMNNSLTPNATAPNSFLGFGGHAASEFDFFPADVNVKPAETQADHRDWEIQREVLIDDAL